MGAFFVRGVAVAAAVLLAAASALCAAIWVLRELSAGLALIVLVALLS